MIARAMAWRDNVLGQPQAIGLLRRAIESDRVAHAYLFHGPDGIGKRAAAVEMACTLLCTRQEGVACGECTGCIGTRKLQHPDVHVLVPQPSDVMPEDVGVYIQTLAKNPYATVNFSRGGKASGKQARYSIDRIRRDLQQVLSLRPRAGGYRVVVMIQADTMNEPAANAFLKLLEEPGDRTVLMLTTSRVDQLLPTIISRCQRVRFVPLAEETIAEALEHRESLKPNDARLYARMAGGSYSTALGLALNETFQQDRETARTFLQLAHARNAKMQVAQIEELARGGREYVKGVLEHVLVWIRDLLLWHVLRNDAVITNIDQRDFIADFSHRLRYEVMGAMADLVDEGRVRAATEIYLKALLLTLSHALGHVMQGGRVESLYMPLTQRRQHI